MNQQQRRCSPRGGFTLTEVLVTIGIIVVIISILIPVVSGVRDKARAADTASLIQTLSSAIERYAQDFRSYPGPLSNAELRGGTTATALTTVAPTGFQGGNILANTVSGSENLVLGLLGGLRMNGTTLEYHPDQVGNGPFSLNPANPKKLVPFVDNINLSWRENAAMERTGDFNDGVDVPDTIIPEFVDRFPEPMPILYLRANKGNGGLIEVDNSEQYNLDHIDVYTLPVGGKTIGTNKKFDESERKDGNKGEHGLQVLGNPLNETMDLYNPPAGRTFYYPYRAGIYFHNPNMPEPATGPPVVPGVARNKDGFILISAGVDRVYGTADDICNFGAVAP